MDAQTALYVGGGSVLLSGLFYLGLRSSAKRLHTILETPTIACRDLPGLGACTVEVHGCVRSHGPLLSDLARVPCVAFECSITEHWTTRETVRDSKGNTRTVTRHHTATRYSNSARINFDVVDDSGAATVEPEGASIDLIGQDAGPAPPGSPAYGVRAHHWNGRLSYSESVLPVGTTVYVLASVSERHTLVKSTTLGDPFIVSHRSEEELIRRARWGKRIFGFLTAAAFVGGTAMIGHWYDLSGGKF